MPVDLTSGNIFGRTGVLVQDEHLVLLTFRGSSDRLRRVPFERVSSVVVKRSVPVIRVIVFVVGIIIPGLLLGMVAASEPEVLPITVAVLVIGVVALGITLYFGQTTFLITTDDGRQKSIQVFARPGKVNRFLARLIERIQIVQDAKRASLASDTPPASSEDQTDHGLDQELDETDDSMTDQGPGSFPPGSFTG